MTDFEFFSETIKKYAINLSELQKSQLLEFEKILIEYNSHTNLVSQNDSALIREKHIADSMAFCHVIKSGKPYKIIDIGSGGGFPVMIEAILLPDSEVFAVDSTSKKTNFLKAAAGDLGLKNLTVINDRIENLTHTKLYRECFDFVTARALGNLAMISELALPFLKLKGKFIAYKASKVQEEIKNAQNTINILGGKIEEIFAYNIFLKEDFERNLVIIKKIKSSPCEYPRNFSAIKKNPL